MLHALVLISNQTLAYLGSISKHSLSDGGALYAVWFLLQTQSSSVSILLANISVHMWQCCSVAV